MFYSAFRFSSLMLLLAILCPSIAQANTRTVRYADSYCEFYPNGERYPLYSMPCTFTIRSGSNNLDILWEDGVRSRFEAINVGSGRNRAAMHRDFVDENGKFVETFFANECDLGISIPSGKIYAADMGYCG